MNRSLFLSLAAGLLASLALTAPSQAGSVLVTTEVSFSVTPSTGTASDIEITYSSAASSPITILPTTTVTGITSSVSGDVVTINFTKVNAGEIDFTFTGSDPGVSLAGANLTGVSGGAKGTITAGVTATSTTIPEPASIALLGIGMTGFLAIRRFFKRTPIA